MRVFNVLSRQHIDRMFKKHWRIQGKRVPIETGAEEHLKKLGIPIFNPQEVLREPQNKLELNIVGYAPKPIKYDKTHPDWHDKVCYFHRDDNVLLLGIDQAKKITKTVEIQEGLPEKLQNNAELSEDLHKKIEKVIMSSCLFDAEQKKLPKLKDSNRPAWVFPRIYGITYSRSCQLMISKLLQICESNARELSNQRTVLNDIQFFVPLNKEDDNILLELTADQLLLSKKALNNFTKGTAEDTELPDIHPVHYTNTLVPENIYQFKNLYPIKSIVKYHPHTVFVYYDTTKVQNLFEEEVTEAQILGRTLMKTFSVAASYARAKFGNDIKVLPEPVSLQCIHTDGRLFHFGALQLNTLDLDGNGIKNIWYTIPRIPLFTSCEYRIGKPVLEGYNPEVIKTMFAFYNNV